MPPSFHLLQISCTLLSLLFSFFKKGNVLFLELYLALVEYDTASEFVVVLCDMAVDCLPVQPLMTPHLIGSSRRTERKTRIQSRPLAVSHSDLL